MRCQTNVPSTQSHLLLGWDWDRELQLSFSWDSFADQKSQLAVIQNLNIFKFTGLPSISSVKILSFGNNKCKLLLNQFILVHLSFAWGDSAPVSCDCFPLAVPPEAVGRITDCHCCRGILFLLDSAGWICILCRRDWGKSSARAELLLFAVRAQQKFLQALKCCLQ